MRGGAAANRGGGGGRVRSGALVGWPGRRLLGTQRRARAVSGEAAHLAASDVPAEASGGQNACWGEGQQAASTQHAPPGSGQA